MPLHLPRLSRHLPHLHEDAGIHQPGAHGGKGRYVVLSHGPRAGRRVWRYGAAPTPRLARHDPDPTGGAGRRPGAAGAGGTSAPDATAAAASGAGGALSLAVQGQPAARLVYAGPTYANLGALSIGAIARLLQGIATTAGATVPVAVEQFWPAKGAWVACWRAGSWIAPDAATAPATPVTPAPAPPAASETDSATARTERHIADLVAMAGSANRAVRLRVIEDSHAPAWLVEGLCHDEDVHVANAAKERAWGS